jgi:hypothetical protein
MIFNSSAGCCSASNSLLFWIWAYESFTNCLALALFCSRADREDWFFKARLTAAKWLSNCEIGLRRLWYR